jgi:hypothetical protein
MKHVLLVTFLLFCSVNVFAQSRIIGPQPARVLPAPCPRPRSKQIPILTVKPIKIKAESAVTSETARVGDYIEFKMMETIYSDEEYPQELFKGQSIFAYVTRRKHRSFPLRKGHIEIALQPLLNWDGTEIQMGIRRHGPVRRNDAKGRVQPCGQALDRGNCVAGRRNWKVAPVVGTIAGAAAGAAGVWAGDDDDDDAFKFFAITSFFTMAKELADLLNGTDAEIKQGEIFDLYIQHGSVYCDKPEKAKPKPEPTEIKILGPVRMETIKP